MEIPMLNRRSTLGTPTCNGRIPRGIGGMLVRRFDPATDSYEDMTQLLHRAFTRLGRMGLNCTCVDQPASITLERAFSGDCFVALCNDKLVGTITLYGHDPQSPCPYYHRGDVATIRQFGIEPMWQSRGIGKMLLALAEHWAAERGYAELALDTPIPAAHLIGFYRRQGFRIVDVFRFEGKRYESAILSKAPEALRTINSPLQIETTRCLACAA
jgi:GNAT superfamily N-acetyltransferase